MLANPKGEVDELPVDRYLPIVTLLKDKLPQDSDIPNCCFELSGAFITTVMKPPYSS